MSKKHQHHHHYCRRITITGTMTSCKKNRRRLRLQLLVCCFYASSCDAFLFDTIKIPGHVVISRKTLVPKRQPYCCRSGQDELRKWRRRQVLIASTVNGIPAAGNEEETSLLDVVLMEEQGDEKAAIWASRSILFQMIRPTSIPGIVLFHFLGIYLATATRADWITVISNPYSWLTLLMINLVSASSMIVNDYYDAKLGRDRYKTDTSNKYILRNKVSLATVRLFLMQLYGVSLFVVACLPGMFTRLSATIALIMTYLYTKHLKPKTFVKNLVCAGLIAFAPVTSGLVSRAILLQSNGGVPAIGRTFGFPPDLWRLTLALLSAVVSREIYMDCNDVKADHLGNILTIPVVYGKRCATKIAQFGNIAMAILITSPPAFQYYSNTGPLRRFVLAGVTSLWQVTRGFQIIYTCGEDKRLIDRTVDGSLLILVLLLASFL